MDSQTPSNQAEIKNKQNKKRQKRRSPQPTTRQPLTLVLSAKKTKTMSRFTSMAGSQAGIKS